LTLFRLNSFPDKSIISFNKYSAHRNITAISPVRQRRFFNNAIEHESENQYRLHKKQKSPKNGLFFFLVWWHKIDLRKIDLFYSKSVRPFIYKDFVISRYTSVMSCAQSATKSNGSA
jgi:hypothetical protein